MSEERREVDMSPEAVFRRLRLVSELLELCRSLQKAKVIGPAREVEARPGEDPGER
jgi:hypothetical protein